MLKKNNCLIIILIVIILGLLMYIYNTSAQIQGIKNAVIEAKQRQAKFKLLENRSALSVFVAVPEDGGETKPMILDSLTARTQPYCEKRSIDSNQYVKKTTKKYKKCKLEITSEDSNLAKAIEITKNPIQILVNNGKKVVKTEMHFFGIAGSNGSYCTTTFRAGRQYQKCISLQEECTEYRMYDFPSSWWSIGEFIEIFPECEGIVTE